MKYFGAYTDNADLVPKSYVDELRETISNLGSDITNLTNSVNYLYSHDEFAINVAFRVEQYKEKNEIFYHWDNYKTLDDNNGSNYVGLLIDPSSRSTSIEFEYTKNDSQLPYYNDSDFSNFPQSPSNVTNNLSDNIIYYVLDLENHLPTGGEIFLYLRTTGDFIFNSYSIRVLIPTDISIETETNNNGIVSTVTVNHPVFFNSKYLTTGDSVGSETTRNGYVDLGCNNNQDLFTSATLHIYFDGTYYFIDTLSGGGTTESSSSQEQPNISHE